MPFVMYHSSEASDLAGGAAISTAEEAFFNMKETYTWWDAQSSNGQKLDKYNYWEDRKRGIILAPANPLKPLSLSTEGPDSNPIVQGLSTGAPPDILVSTSGQVAIPAGDLCIWAVAKAGINAACPLFSVAGNNGGGFSVHLRSGNLLLFRTETAGLVYQTRISQTLSSASFWLVQCNVDSVNNAVNFYANGELLNNGTPSGGIYTYDPTFPSARMSWFGEYDVTNGVSANPARSMSVAMCGVATTYAPNNAAWQAALETMVSERFPSLGL